MPPSLALPNPRSAIGATDIEVERIADVYHGEAIPQDVRRAWLLHPEARLWMAVLDDAVESAVKLGRGRTLPGENTRAGAWRQTQQKRIEELHRWLVLPPRIDAPVGSLPWIADVLSSSTGLVLDVHRLRRVVLGHLSRGKGAKERARVRRSKRGVVGA